MKKILSLMLAMALLVSGMVFPSFAEEELGIVTITEDMISASGATVEYDSYLHSFKITPIAAGEAVSVTITGNAPCFAVWTPATIADTVLSLKIENETHYGVYDATLSHKFENYFSFENPTISYTPSEIYSIYLFEDTYDLEDDISPIEIAANGSLHYYNDEDLHLDYYEVDRYTDYYWDGGIVYNESFYVITDENGIVQPNAMMYEIDRVVSVQDAYLEKEYVYGTDYLIEDGKLVIPDTSSIYVYDHSQVFQDTTNASGWWKTLDGTYVLGGQYNMYFTGYLNITYTTKDTWEGAIPESKGMYLENSINKLASGETVKFLGIGDSIAGGANVSADLNVEPYADVWSDMTAKALQERYPEATVVYDTIAQGGATATLAIERMDEILAFDPDILVIEFGTNECMAGDSAAVYIDTLKQAIAAVNANIPDCDIVLLAPIISNPLIFPIDWFYAYSSSLYTLEREGVAVADATSVMQYMLTRKDYLDMTGDFLCHPNDFVSRAFAQSILKTFEHPSDGGAQYREGLANRLYDFRYENEFYPEQWAEIVSLADSGYASVMACGDNASALEAYIEWSRKIDAVMNIGEVDASAALDCANIIFDIPKAYETVTSTSNLGAQFSAEQKALLLTITYARNPSATIDYTIGDTTVSADDYDYAVVTVRVPETNGTRSKASKLVYNTSAGSTTAVTVDLTRDDMYHSYIVDLSADANWTGTVNSLTYTAFATSTNGDQLLVSSIILAKDMENAKDIAIERERAANNNAAEAYTILMSDSAMCEMLETEGASEQYISGDGDKNGVLNAKDALLLRRVLAGYEVEADFTAIDMDASGTVDSADIILMRQTLSGVIDEVVIGGSQVDIAYDEENESAILEFNSAAVPVTIDLSDKALSADMFKYITVCAKTATGEACNVSITLTTDAGSYSGSTVVEAIAAFSADSAKFVDGTGNIISVTLTFQCEAGDVIYLDSVVLTPTISSAENAEIVRVGAANLI